MNSKNQTKQSTNMASSEKLFTCLVLAALVACSTAQRLIPISGVNELPTITTTTAPTSTTPTTTTTTTTTTPAPNSTTPSDEVLEFTSYSNTTTFSCEGKATGYYADVKLNCRVYHFCTQMDSLEGPAYQRMSYMCLEGSFFDQKDLNCVVESDLKVPCHKAESEFDKSNRQFDAREETPPSMSDSLAANIMMNPIARFIAGR